MRYRQVIKLLVSVVICLICLSGVSWAGELKISATTNLTADLEGGEVHLSGTYTVQNLGDESAKDVFPHFNLGNWIWAGDPVNLNINQSYTWNIESRFPQEKLACNNNSLCSGLDLPTRGKFPLLVKRFYRDANGYQFSAPDVFLLMVGPLSEEESASIQMPNIQLGMPSAKGDGQEFDVVLRLANQSMQPYEAAVSFMTASEFRMMNVSSVVEIPGGKEDVVDVRVENFSGLNGSQYPVFGLVQWDENGVRNAQFSFTIVALSEPLHTYEYVYAGIAGVVLLLVLFYFVVLRKPSKPNSSCPK